MFEYTCRNGKKVTINPKMITAIFQGEYEDECDIYTCDGIDAIVVKADYEEVRNFWYRCLM